MIFAVVVVVVVRVVRLSSRAERWYASPTSVASSCVLCPQAYVITASPAERSVEVG